MINDEKMTAIANQFTEEFNQLLARYAEDTPLVYATGLFFITYCTLCAGPDPKIAMALIKASVEKGIEAYEQLEC